MTRTILIHLNIEVDDEPYRSTEDVIRLVEGAVEVGLSGDEGYGLDAAVALAEEV